MAETNETMGNRDSQHDDSFDNEGSGDEADDTGLVQNSPRPPRKISEKKRSDTAAFLLFVEKNRGQLSKKDKKEPRNDEEKSAAHLLQDIKGAKIIESPRDYQVELFERAKEKNTIAVLDTGKPCQSCSFAERGANRSGEQALGRLSSLLYYCGTPWGRNSKTAPTESRRGSPSS